MFVQRNAVLRVYFAYVAWTAKRNAVLCCTKPPNRWFNKDCTHHTLDMQLLSSSRFIKNAFQGSEYNCLPLNLSSVCTCNRNCWYCYVVDAMAHIPQKRGGAHRQDVQHQPTSLGRGEGQEMGGVGVLRWWWWLMNTRSTMIEAESPVGWPEINRDLTSYWPPGSINILPKLNWSIHIQIVFEYSIVIHSYFYFKFQILILYCLT